MGFGAHWEREKNAALVELDSRNKALQSKLHEAAKDENDISSEVRRMHENIMHAIHEIQHEGAASRHFTTTATIPPTKESSNEVKGATSVWEWQKNTALLELEQRNQELQSMLKAKDRKAALSAEDKELLSEGYERGKECMRLFAQVRAMQRCLVLQAQRISSGRRLCAVMSHWHHRSRQNKMLNKAESQWDRRTLRKSMVVLCVNRAQKKVTRKLKSVAERHRRKRMLVKSFQWWILSIQTRVVFAQRLSLFRVLQRSRLLRTAFGAWKAYSVSLAEKQASEVKVARFFVVHRTIRVWQRLKGLVVHTQRCNVRAETYCRFNLLTRTLQTWTLNAHESIAERSHGLLVEQQRRMSLLGQSLNTWHFFSHFRALQHRRLERLASSRIRKTLFLTFMVLKQRAQNKKGVRIWRNMFLAKYKVELKQRAFLGWSWILKQRKKVLFFQTRKSSKRRLEVLQSWFRLVDNRRLVSQRMVHMRRRSNHRHLIKAFKLWLIHVEEGRRMGVLSDAKLLQTQLELSQHDLHGAGSIQAEMTKLVRNLEKEKRIMMSNMQAVRSRTPVWTSGFLDAELRWRTPRTISGTPPTPRAGHVSVALQSSPLLLLVAGGYNGEIILNDMFVFNEADGSWKTPKVVLKDGSSFPPPVRHHTACAFQGLVIIFGGFDGSRDSADLSVLAFSEDGGTCELSQPDWHIGIKPGSMSQHSSCLVDGRGEMVVFGGYRANTGHLNELWVLDLQWMEWHIPEYTGEPPSPRRGHGAVALGRRMYVFGGYDGKSNLADLHVLDLDEMHWESVKGQGEAPSPRRQHAMAASGRHFVLYGGYDGENYLEDVYSFDTVAFIWKRWTVMKPEVEMPGKTLMYRRSMHTMVASGHRFVVVGGVHEHGSEQELLFLENGAAVDGVELQNMLTEQKNKAETLQEQVVKYEGMLRNKVADLAFAYSKVGQCQAALEVEIKARKNAVAQEKVLIHKLKKVRKKASLW